MSKQDFENLLNKHQQEDIKVDWAAQKTEWLNFIVQFYKSVEAWLKPYADQNKLSYKFNEVSFVEENIGSYAANTMNINFAGQQVTIKPIGTLLIGTKGRIDMEGPRGRVQFVLADRESKGAKITVTVSIDGKPPAPKVETRVPDWTWKIVRRESTRIAYDDFIENNFFNALMEIVND